MGQLAKLRKNFSGLHTPLSVARVKSDRQTLAKPLPNHNCRVTRMISVVLPPSENAARRDMPLRQTAVPALVISAVLM